MDESTAQRVVILAAQRDHEASAVAALAWMAWDAIIHLEDERVYVWSGPTGWVKWIYAFIRYAPIVHGGAVLHHYNSSDNPSSRCRAYIAWELSFLEVLTVAVEIILMGRVFILYNQSRRLKLVILTIFAAEIMSMMLFIGFVIRSQKYTEDCTAAVSPAIFTGYWLIALVFELFLFIMTLARCSRKTLHDSRLVRKHSVLFVFLRDGTWAFAIIFGVTFANMLLYETLHTPRAALGYFWELAVLSFAGSHVILNIRRLAAPGDILQADGTSSDHHTSQARWASLVWNHRSDVDQADAPPGETTLPCAVFGDQGVSLSQNNTW